MFSDKACVYHFLCDVVSRLEKLDVLVVRQQENSGVRFGADHKIDRVSWLCCFYGKPDIYLSNSQDGIIIVLIVLGKFWSHQGHA